MNRFTDSMSNYSTVAQLIAKWNGTSGASGKVVGGTYAIGAAAQGMDLTSTSTTGAVIVGVLAYGHYFFGIRQKWVSGASGASYFFFTDTAGRIYHIDFSSVGIITILNNGSVVATSTLNVAVGQTHYYEIEALLGTSGILKLWVDGVLFATFTGSTLSTTNLINSFGCGSGGGGGSEVYLADCYINDDIGSVCNTRQGDTTIQSYRVGSAGTYAQFLRGGTDTGTNQGQLNKALADPTSYNASNLVNNRDSFHMNAVPAPPGGLLGARLWINVQKDSFGPRQLALTQISGAADHTGATQIVSGPGYGWLSEDQSIDANTSALWSSVTPLNLAEFGYKIIS